MEDKKKNEEQFEFNRILELNQRLKNLKERELLNKRIKFTAYIMNIEKNMSFTQEKCHFAQMAFFLCFFIV